MVKTVAVVNLSDLTGNIDARAERVLKQIGALNESVSQDAFQKQRLGSIEWKVRYPNQSEPFVNIAGVIADLSEGGQIKTRRFERRPALIDRGLMRGSIKSRAIGKRSVETGSALPYASKHQHGGVSDQRVTDQVKTGLIRFLLGRAASRIQPPRTMKEYARFRTLARDNPYADKLAPIVLPQQRLWQTEVNARPFVGITEESERDILRIVEEGFARGDG